MLILNMWINFKIFDKSWVRKLLFKNNCQVSRRGGTRDYKLNDVMLMKEHIHYAFP